MNDYVTFKADEISERDVDECFFSSDTLETKSGSGRLILFGSVVWLMEANFVEAMADFEVKDSYPGKGEPLKISVDVNLLGCLIGWYVVLIMEILYSICFL